MKYNFLFITSLLFLLIACENPNGSVTGSPEEAMNGFVEKLKAGDYEGAKEFTSAETDGAMDFLKQKAKTQEAMGQEPNLTDAFNGIDIQQATVSCGEAAEASATCKLCQDEKCQDVEIIQQGGKWLVHIPKEKTVE